jgi:hypothetical protein
MTSTSGVVLMSDIGALSSAGAVLMAIECYPILTGSAPALIGRLAARCPAAALAAGGTTRDLTTCWC